MDRKKLIITFTFLSVIMLIICLGGIPVFEQDYIQSGAIVWFIITGLMTLICLFVSIYNIIMMIKERNEYTIIN